ncbi:hypothetical protein CC2G_006329 [Coprinopsis cinerea AmutBmut pab1-1]|nr:hypothetical protein CC2G_006329 [Coprinopsis cinerea AmutBmut pab1-1]
MEKRDHPCYVELVHAAEHALPLVYHCPSAADSTNSLAATGAFHLALFLAIVSICQFALVKDILLPHSVRSNWKAPSMDTCSFIWLSCMGTVVSCWALTWYAWVYNTVEHTIIVRRATLVILNIGILLMLGAIVYPFPFI